MKYFFLVGGRARAEARIILGHCERHALLHMASECLTHWTTWAGWRRVAEDNSIMYNAHNRVNGELSHLSLFY